MLVCKNNIAPKLWSINQSTSPVTALLVNAFYKTSCYIRDAYRKKNLANEVGREGQVCGIDPASAMIERAQAKANKKL